MAQKLVIVESPTKAKILKKILGRGYAVESSTGHIRDLPEKKEDLSAADQKLPYARLGIDVDNDFRPLYCSSPTKKKRLSKLKELIGPDTELFLATDEDREGEAIAWHLNEVLNPKDALKACRVVFHEITPAAILNAFEHPRPLDMHMVDAQQARRILDRLVGFRLSPLLWKKIRFGLSAGRVQSAAVRIIMERELEIRRFISEEYWSVTAQFAKSGISFEAPLTKRKGEKFEPKTEAEAQMVMAAVRSTGQKFTVGPLETKMVRRNPSPPFTTSTLQQEASRKLGFSVKKTMQLAQKLYEGVELKGEATGLITYMRTDSLNLSKTALEQTHAMLGQLYGKDYQLPEPRLFKTKSKGAQEAHEAIRPTDVFRKPESLKNDLDADMLKLYDLIWKRTLATQAPRAEFEAVSTDLNVGEFSFRATGQTLKFAGFIRIYVEGDDNPEEALEDRDKLLPALLEGETLKSEHVEPKQHFTKPPARYTEASLVKKMEEVGIGRPSTYAPTISTIISRGYVEMENKVLSPTDTAEVVDGLLVAHFPNIVDLNFTATMEDSLDDIAEGKREHIPFLHSFYTPFNALVEEKDKSIKKEDIVNEPSTEICELCGKPMVVKLSRMGKFLSCSGYPDCKNAKSLVAESEERKLLKEKHKDQICPECARPMVVKASRYGDFLACTGYPKCKKALPIVKSSGVTCPMCLKNELVEKRGKTRNSSFWGCNGYPECDYLTRFQPLRNAEPGERGFFYDKKGEETFLPFDQEAWTSSRERSAERKKKINSAKAVASDE